MRLLGFELYCVQLVREGKLLAYALHYSMDKSLKQLKRIAEFHGLKGEIVENETFEREIKRRIENFIFNDRKPKIKLDIYRYAEVYRKLLKIPRGCVKSYSEIAKDLKLSMPLLIKILAHNPMLILIPCHRIIRKDGSISGYTPLGKKFKEVLLRTEGYKIC